MEKTLAPDKERRRVTQRTLLSVSASNSRARCENGKQIKTPPYALERTTFLSALSADIPKCRKYVTFMCGRVRKISVPPPHLRAENRRWRRMQTRFVGAVVSYADKWMCCSGGQLVGMDSWTCGVGFLEVETESRRISRGKNLTRRG